MRSRSLGEPSPPIATARAFVPLADVTEPELVAASILQSLGLAGADPERALLDELGGRELLLVLDNFEQVVDAAPLVARLLESAPSVVVLVTSRTLLRVSGEREFSVPPLSPPNAAELFVDRARAVASDLPADPGDQAIGEICARLEGLPLAIELAAARVRLLPPQALLARLTSRLDMLVGSRRDAPERQRTMRGAIEWSYRLLEPDEQLLFARFGVFLGGASLAAVEAVCGDVATLDLLESLVDKSLLRQRGSEEPRYTMLETLRDYALEQLAAMGEEEEIRRRHVVYFEGFVHEAEKAINGREQRQWLDRLEADHANLRLAIDNARGRDDNSAAVAIAGGLRMFWYVHGHAEEGLRVLDAVLAEAEGTPALARSKAHNGAAMLASDLGDYAAVRRHLLQSLELARELGDPLRVGIAQMNLGNVELFEQNWDEAERLYREALRIYRDVNDLREQAIVLEDLALVALARGDEEGAIATLEEAIELAREAEAPHEIGSARLELARILIVRGESERPRRLASDAYDIFRTLDARPRIADTLDTYAGIAMVNSAYEDAAQLFGAAEAIRGSIGAVRQPDQERWVKDVLATVRGGFSDDDFERERAAGKGLDADTLDALCARYRG